MERRCLKWARMTHLDIWNASYCQKKGWESNCQFDSRPLKVKNRPDFLACRWCVTYRSKALDEGYNFSWDLISIKGLHTKLWAPKVVEVPTLRISGLPFGSPRKNVIFVATPLWAKCEGEAHIPKSGKLESSGTFENSELDCRGQISLHLSVLGVIGKVLKSRC